MKNNLKCFHCGDLCLTQRYKIEDKFFCCNGCLTVYQIIQSGGLADYYDLTQNPGITPEVSASYYDFLDQETIQKEALLYQDKNLAISEFEVPGIHCSSCIWLLENLTSLDKGVIKSEVNFFDKKLKISFHPFKTSLRRVAELLSTLGYPPFFNLHEKQEKTKRLKSKNRKLLFQIGIAGFCFGNIMLLAFPHYLNVSHDLEEKYRQLFSYVSLGLAVPVLLFSASDYWRSAWNSIKKLYINIDVPITLGMITLFSYSIFQIFSGTGNGYLDSLSGLVFFLLLGKFFQQRTYSALSFENDYRSFFPVAINKINGDKEESVLIDTLKEGDQIKIRNGEIIPVDGELQSDKAFLDYSFITGEPEPVEKQKGDFIYAGAKYFGSKITIEVKKKLSDSELLALWNSGASDESKKSIHKPLIDSVSKYFTIVVLGIAFTTLIYWIFVEPSKALMAFCAVLIVACPCALALSIPFTYGTVMRVFARNKFFLKNSILVERMQKVTDLVFDKTGTLTNNESMEVQYEGIYLDEKDSMLIKSAAANSLHIASKKIAHSLTDVDALDIYDFEEFPGNGIKAVVDNHEVIIGRLSFVSEQVKFRNGVRFENLSGSYVAIDGNLKGRFYFRNNYRKGLHGSINELKKGYKLHLLTGDSDVNHNYLRDHFDSRDLYFDKKPSDKKAFINELQAKGHKVAMIGDGLNDAGALEKSYFSISVTDDTSLFTPAAKSILSGDQLYLLPRFFKLSKAAGIVLIASFVISFLYNSIGLLLAVQGLLSPVMAAILMPLSSITVVAFTTGSILFLGKREKL